MADPPAVGGAADGSPTRRRLLAAVGAAAAGAASALAGCIGRAGPGRPGSAATSSTAGTPRRLARRGSPPDVCERPLVDLGIHAIVDPAFAAPGDERLVVGDDDPIVGVVSEGRARAYPVATLLAVEVVNDSLGSPLLVTYCPVCRSGMVARRVVGGEATRFGVSGQVWEPPGERIDRQVRAGDVFAVDESDPDPGGIRRDGNLVLYDAATGSYWSQLLAEAICGPARGRRLPVVAAETATYGEWRRAHPGTDVLLPPPASTARNPEPPGGYPASEGAGESGGPR